MTSKLFLLIVTSILGITLSGQEATSDISSEYKKRVLESAEIDFLSSYYSQDGDNAAVSGGIGSESLNDATGTIIIAIPLNDDDVLTIDAGISAYTSASSSNINPFDGKGGAEADPFVASSGESKADQWINFTAGYSHSSDDRNQILSGKVSFSNEYDYRSLGIGGSYAKLFNQKNTEINLSANAYFDQWSLIYPTELRGTNGQNGDDDDDDDDDYFNLDQFTITGGSNYMPSFTRLNGKSRNSYSIGVGLSQILSTRMHGSLSLDFISQNGLLSTPFQRVYFGDVEDSFIENFHLADDIERLPNSRQKIALGGRLNYYVSERISMRSFLRYYQDNWGIQSTTASLELPIKLSDYFTIYPSYRYYVQSAADYFAPYNEHLSTEAFYTSDYDLSAYNSNQFGIGIGYTDILTSARLWKVGLKSIDLKYYNYQRNSTFGSSILTLGIKFVIE